MMAAHIVCHNNDIMPKSFPPPRPTQQEHGFMSEYGPSRIMHSTFPPHAKGKEEFMPVIEKPTPMFNTIFNLSDIYDPALSLTPEKKATRSRAPLNRGSDEGTNLKPNNSSRVRFDNFVEIQELPPKVSDGITMVTSVIRDSPDPAKALATGINNFHNDPEPENETQDSGSSLNSGIYDELEPVSVLASDLASNTRLHAGSTRITTVNSQDSQANIDSTTSAYILNEQPEHVLARPEFNSTLRVSKEIRDLENTQLDVAAAVKQKLHSSARLTTTISDKATSKLNTNCSQFDNLVSVDVSEEYLASVVERRRLKVKPAIKANKPEAGLVSAPDILEYLTPDLQTQTASLSLDGLPPQNSTPSTASLSRAFDVYKHIRTWQSW